MVAQTHAQETVLHLVERSAPTRHISPVGAHVLSDAEVDIDAKPAVKVGKIRWEDLSQLAILQPGEARCDYCGKVFRPTRKNNVYCNSIREREQQIIRKENLIITLACHLEAFGWKAKDMLLLARQMVSSAYKGVMRALEAWGYRWVESKKQWVLKPNLATRQCLWVKGSV